MLKKPHASTNPLIYKGLKKETDMYGLFIVWDETHNKEPVKVYDLTKARKMALQEAKRRPGKKVYLAQVVSYYFIGEDQEVKENG